MSYPPKASRLFPLLASHWRQKPVSAFQKHHGLPNSGASLTARHPLEPKLLSHAEGDNISHISYPPEASGYSPSGGYLGELPLEDAIIFLPSKLHGLPPSAASLPFFSLSMLVVTQIQGHTAGSYPPSQLRFVS